MTALHYAALCGNTKAVEWIVEHGADINVKTFAGSTPLLFAVRSGLLDIAEFLLSCGATLNDTPYSAIMEAAECGRLEVLKWLVKQGADLDTIIEPGGRSVMHFAASSGHLETVKWLVLQGGDVDSIDDSGQTLLHLAAENGHLDLCHWLLLQGLEVDQPDCDGVTPLRLAVRGAHADVVSFLLLNHADPTLHASEEESIMKLATRNFSDMQIKYIKSKLG
jgi:ankyrin repeat protein